MQLKRALFGVSASVALFIQVAVAGGLPAPSCLEDREHARTPIGVINAQLLEWKRSEPDQFSRRGHLAGIALKPYDDRSGHDHFPVRIGPDANDIIEVIYNQEFGDLPAIVPGMQVEACGDFIVSKVAGQYPKSPAGAIIHWVHASNTPDHEHGYVIINGVLYGQKVPARKQFPGRRPNGQPNAGNASQDRLSRVLNNARVIRSIRRIQDERNAMCGMPSSDQVRWRCGDGGCGYRIVIPCGPARGATFAPFGVQLWGFDNGQRASLQGVRLIPLR